MTNQIQNHQLQWLFHELSDKKIRVNLAIVGTPPAHSHVLIIQISETQFFMLDSYNNWNLRTLTPENGSFSK